MKLTVLLISLFLTSSSLALPHPDPQPLTTTPALSSSLVPRANDYPYKSSCPGSGVDKWTFYKCQCTSFVAWRITDRLNINFKNDYKGQHFGNAENWDNAARKIDGVKVNKTPKKNSVAVYNGGSTGHVAWVTKVDGDDVTVEEYNWDNVEKYGKRTVKKTKFNAYIHF